MTTQLSNPTLLTLAAGTTLLVSDRPNAAGLLKGTACRVRTGGQPCTIEPTLQERSIDVRRRCDAPLLARAITLCAAALLLTACVSRPPTPRLAHYDPNQGYRATNWQAPNWIGQPVQWCGLVYRSALEDLARVDEAQRGTWQTLARGITITGLQMCFPIGDAQQRGGLMPDYFLLKQQVSDGPAINPGTVQTHLAEAYGKTPMVTVTRLANGSLVHAPGEVRQEPSGDGTLRLSVTAWPEDEYRILVTRVDRTPVKVLWNGAEVTPQFLEGAHAMSVTLKGRGVLELMR